MNSKLRLRLALGASTELGLNTSFTARECKEILLEVRRTKALREIILSAISFNVAAHPDNAGIALRDFIRERLIALESSPPPEGEP